MRRHLSVLLLCALVGASAPVFAQSARGSQPAATNEVGSLDITEGADGTYIRIRGTSVPTFSVFKLTNPLRLFVDISNSRLADQPETRKVDNGVISKVALLDVADGQSNSRLIVGFDRPAHYDVKADGDDVVVFVDGEHRAKRGAGVAKIESKLRETEQKLARVESAYRQELSASQQRVAEATAELDRARTQLSDAEARMAELRARAQKASGADRDELQARIERQDALLTDSRRKLEQRQRTLDQLDAKLGAIRAERDQALARLEQTRKELGAERDAAKQRADALAAQLDQTRQQLAGVAAEKNSLKSRLDSMSTQVRQSAQRVEEQMDALDQARTREARLEAQLGELRKALANGDESARDELEKVEAEKASLAKRLDDQKQALQASRQQAAEATARLDRLQSLVSQREAEVARLQRELEQARNSRAAEARTDRSAAESAELAARLDKLRTEAAAEQQRLAELERRRVAEQSELAELQSRRDKTHDELAEANRQLAAREATLDEIRQRENLPAARAVAVDPDNSVRDIRLETDGRRSRIVVELDRPPRFETLAGDDSRAVMILNGVELPEHLQRTLSSDAQGGAVRFLSSFADAPGQVRMEAELSGGVSETVRQDGNRVVWEFAQQIGAATAEAPVVDQQAPARTTDGQSFTSAPPGYPRVVTDASQVSRVPGMKRTRLTIDLREADIDNVLRLMAKEGGVNIIAGEGVGGTVTMRLRSVPLDQAFLTVLQSLDLGFEVRGNVIRVAPAEQLREEETARAEARARAEKLQPLQVYLLPINYARAGELQSQVQGLLSPRGTVTVDERTNTLIIKDIPDNLASIQQLVESLDSQVPQVLIEARIVETNDTFQRQLGIQWGGDVTFAQGNGNPTGLIFPSTVGLAGGATDGQTPTAGTSANPNFAVNLPAPAGTGSGGAIGLTLGSVGGGVNLNLRLSALEAQGHAKIVSAPKILTLDNRAATISQGTSIPISVVSAAGVQTVFVDATLELEVLPHVTPDGNVQLQITATKNEPDFQNTGARGDPTIIRKQAETELLIKDGDTTVIGGIYTRNAGSSVSAVPFFYKIPILGHFFKTTSQSERRTELLIFITPRIVNRAQALGGVGGMGSRGGIGQSPEAAVE